MPKTKLILTNGEFEEEFFTDIPVEKLTFKDFKDIFPPDEHNPHMYLFEYYDDAFG
jgi:hypothetical protein